ncbi:MAG: purine-binding chemotaxis protein CheW [Phycisphaeraceae bacterium]|nr:purine-binding chemotaxis protein CheW [Phycisphaeraceae bacterium]
MTTTLERPATAGTGGHGGNGSSCDRFLSFCLGEEEYALEILAVREIICLLDITPLPQTPHYVKGVINLRGRIIPVIELRAKFGLTSTPYTEQTCIIVVEVEDPASGDATQIGIIVDSVREVLDIARGQIDPTPSFGCSVPVQYLLGIGKVRSKVVILLSIRHVITAEDAARIAAAPAPCESAGDVQPASV